MMSGRITDGCIIVTGCDESAGSVPVEEVASWADTGEIARQNSAIPGKIRMFFIMNIL
jgi:hypothetical protein